MSTIIEMPKLSDTMTVGTVVKWYKGEGDEVSNGDILAEIETDKATMEVEALDDGVIAKIIVAEGSQNVAVNALIAVLAEEGEDASEAAKIAEGAEVAPVPAKAAPAAPVPAPAPRCFRGANASPRWRLASCMLLVVSCVDCEFTAVHVFSVGVRTSQALLAWFDW